jgi:hypothetical protein
MTARPQSAARGWSDRDSLRSLFLALQNWGYWAVSPASLRRLPAFLRSNSAALVPYHMAWFGALFGRCRGHDEGKRS